MRTPKADPSLFRNTPIQNTSKNGKDKEKAINAIVAERIRQRRLDIGLKQTELAKILGVSFQQVQKYEYKVNRVFAGRLWQIANILGVPPEYFFIDQPRKTKKKISNPLTEQHIEFDIFYTIFCCIKNPKIKQEILDLIILIVENDMENQ
ncbi:MAG: helix-turn-helix transcriptional regulator [Kordiimonadaceae bacterium]|nr:helix-turn-helix transcriptional regulator [Kordiimonadaceae bacterium]